LDNTAFDISPFTKALGEQVGKVLSGSFCCRIRFGCQKNLRFVAISNKATLE
jgi:hypothetical protein